MIGKGSITYSNGNYYEGEWKDLKRHGQGYCGKEVKKFMMVNGSTIWKMVKEQW